MHRIILGLDIGDKRQGDHRNHNTLDNRRDNLRIVTHQQNGFNRKSAKGYTWIERVHKYRAQIKVDNISIALGHYATEELAHAAYLTAKQKYHII